MNHAHELLAHWHCVVAEPLVYWTYASADWIIGFCYVVVPWLLWRKTIVEDEGTAGEVTRVRVQLTVAEARAIALFVLSCGTARLIGSLTFWWEEFYVTHAVVMWWCAIQSVWCVLLLRRTRVSR